MPKPVRWCACFDNHGDQADSSAVRVFFDFVKYWKPQIRVHGGDAMDLRWLRGRASEKEKRERIKADVDMGKDFIKKYKPTHFLMGNHDWRLVKGMHSDEGPLMELCTRIHDEFLGALGNAKVYPWGKRVGVMQLGDLRIVHGYHSGETAARNVTRDYNSTAMMGHIHANNMYSASSYDSNIGYTVGCLCKLDMDYNAGQAGTLRQNHGLAYGLLLPNNKTITWTAFPRDGVWYFPTEFKEVRA